MYRKIYQKLLKWKNEENGTVAILIDGARRVGKSYIAKEFAEKEYKSYILIDFNNVQNEIKDLFNHYLSNLDYFFTLLQNYYQVKLYKRESIIIFDEVQLFPRARAAIKYLVADGRYDYIETGSLMSIKSNIRDIVIPSEERHIELNPFDFEEFLLALGEENLINFIREQFIKQQPLTLLHRKVLDYFRQYMLVGGMPQAVNEYVKTKDFDRVDNIKRDILNLYRNDIAKYAENYRSKVLSIFDEIPTQLQKHEKKFKLSSIKKEAKFRDYEDAFFWLDDAMIVNTCFNSSEPSLGLRMNLDRLTLKCYMADTGLLISHTFDSEAIVKESLYKKILFDKLEINKGMLVENIVAQMLKANGHKLFFYSNPSNIDVTSKMEIDFLLSKSKITSRHNISVIEVKSSNNYTLTSLKKFINKYNNQLDKAYVIHQNDLKIENNIIYLPIYMTMYL